MNLGKKLRLKSQRAFDSHWFQVGSITVAISQLQHAKLIGLRHRQTLSLHIFFFLGKESWTYDIEGNHMQPRPKFKQIVEGELQSTLLSSMTPVVL